MDEQQRVAAFLAEHDLHTTPTYRVLDLASEVGELAKDVNETTDYGDDPSTVAVSASELGDALFCVLALANEAGIDAGDALDLSLEKYEGRLASSGTAGSGSHDM